MKKELLQSGVKSKRGLFISFEGLEACGKTTQIQRLETHLKALGQSVLLTREPGGTAIGESIRKILLSKDTFLNMCPETELLLFTASRAQLVRELIGPELERGTCVLCDRFLDSTTVYQGVARRLAFQDVNCVNQFAVGGLLPDLTIILDLLPTESLKRLNERKHEPLDRIEQEALEFHERLREGYLRLPETHSERFLIVDGNQSADAIECFIWKEMEERFGPF